MPRQGFIEYPGVVAPISGSYTLSHGITPGSFVIQLVPQANLVPEYGDVRLTFDGETITFPDCKLVAPSSQFNEAGQLISITVLDRRWRWRFGEISGKYNLRRPNGLTVDPLTSKTPTELARLCLEAMEETVFDVDSLPATPRPEIDWDYDNPAQELAELCEELGFRVVLGTDNVIRLCQKGIGQALPDTGREITFGYGIDAGVRPSSVKFVAGGTRFQTRFKLEPVGLTRGGSYLPIDQLPYKPSGGWTGEFPNSFVGVLAEFGTEAHQLALRSVYRMYRIKGTAPSGNTFTFGHEPTQVDGLEDILPVESILVDDQIGADGVYRPAPATVRGVFWRDDSLQPQENTGTETKHERYHKSFSVIGDYGVIEFSDPVVKIEDDKILPADLYFECAHMVRVPEVRQVHRWTLEREIPGPQFQTPPMIIQVDESALTVVQEYDAEGNPTFARKNETYLEHQATSYLAQTVLSFQQPQSLEITYEGFVNISPDGTIVQVGWQFGERGAFTTAALNSEFDMEMPSFEERRRREREGRAKRNARRVIAAGKKLARSIRKLFR